MLPRDLILSLTGATTLEVTQRVQSLWNGYGEIVRVALDGAPAIVKHVVPPQAGKHPRGWDTDLSQQRKLHSYGVELQWYQLWSKRCTDDCRVARPLACTEFKDGGWLFVLEDLDAAGFPERRSRLERKEVGACLGWLAEFHALFLGETPKGLWDVGTYWHLGTRPDELAAMPDSDLKRAAAAIDAQLNNARYQSFVHGDAKVANFCFAPDGKGVAAVDFQYVGAGCGVKDVAYLLGSCLSERECDQNESSYLDLYFRTLGRALKRDRPDIDSEDLENEWRELFVPAWADFYRFLAGWSPGHAKMNPYSERMAAKAVAQINARRNV